MKAKFVFNEELFINLIRESDCLYINPASANYKDESIRSNCWADIARVLCLEEEPEAG